MRSIGVALLVFVGGCATYTPKFLLCDCVRPAQPIRLYIAPEVDLVGQYDEKLAFFGLAPLGDALRRSLQADSVFVLAKPTYHSAMPVPRLRPNPIRLVADSTEADLIVQVGVDKFAYESPASVRARLIDYHLFGLPAILSADDQPRGIVGAACKVVPRGQGWSVRGATFDAVGVSPPGLLRNEAFRVALEEAGKVFAYQLLQTKGAELQPIAATREVPLQFSGIAIEPAFTSIGYEQRVRTALDSHYMTIDAFDEDVTHLGGGLRCMAKRAGVIVTYQPLTFETRNFPRYAASSDVLQPMTFTMDRGSSIGDIYALMYLTPRWRVRFGAGGGLSLAHVRGTIFRDSRSYLPPEVYDYSNTGYGWILATAMECLVTRHVGVSLTGGHRELSVQTTDSVIRETIDAIDLGGPFVRFGTYLLFN